MDLTDTLTQWADQIRAIAANGLTYAENIYDKERYTRLQKLAIEMYAKITGMDGEHLRFLLGPLLDHPTPVATADAAIFNAHEQILLIRRSDNKKWALPGGFLDVGETPAKGAVREAKEETGVLCRPVGDSKHISHEQEVLGSGWFEEAKVPGELSPGHELKISQSFRVRRGESAPNIDLS